MIIRELPLKISIPAILFFSFIITGCKYADTKCISSKNTEIPQKLYLKFPGQEPGVDQIPAWGIQYNTFQCFDFSSLKGYQTALDTPFVYVRKSDNLIVVRMSNDIEHPYVFTNHGDYWHCKWISNERGEDIAVDRFINDGNIYEYIQKRISDTTVEKTLVKHDYHLGHDISSKNYLFVEETKYFLETSSTFSDSVPESFNRLIQQRNTILHNDSLAESTDDHFNIIRTFTPDKNITQQEYAYFILSPSSAIFYTFSPLQIYDDHKDCQRVPFLKRIR